MRGGHYIILLFRFLAQKLEYTSNYKALNMQYFMVKSQLEQRHLIKGCYGTNEWSKNSGICRNCKWKDDCGKVKPHDKIK